ncbi:hypothetical protein V8C42DRAFT_322489 [Trichoderma barbatum]
MARTVQIVLILMAFDNNSIIIVVHYPYLTYILQRHPPLLLSFSLFSNLICHLIMLAFAF